MHSYRGAQRTAWARPAGTCALVLCALLNAARVAGQGDRVHVSRYTVDDGLAQNLVTALVQDSAGFLWIGTNRGLQRFDGYTFVPYRSLDPNAPGALSGRITGLLVDDQQRLWVKTPSGLFFGRGRLRGLGSVAAPLHWAPDSTGKLWVWESAATRAIDWRNAAPHLTAASLPFVTGCCTAVATGRGALWLATAPTAPNAPASITRVDSETGERGTYALAAVTFVRVVLEDENGRVWVGGMGGVEVLEPGAHQFRALASFRGHDAGDIKRDGSGSLLIATARWLARVDRNGEIRQRWAAREAFAEPLPPRSIVLDREGGFWLTTTTAGLVRIDTQPLGFTHAASTSNPALALRSDFVMALHEARDGSLWLGTLGGGAYRVLDGAPPAAVPHPLSDALADQIWSIEEDNVGGIWFGTSAGLCRIAHQSLQCRRPARGSSAAVVDLARDRDGWLWLARDQDGVSSFDPRSGRFHEELRDRRILTLFADPDSNYLWFGSNGLLRARIAGGAIVQPIEQIAVELSEDDLIFDIRRDLNGAVWLATERGLQRWDASRQSFAPVDVAELNQTTVFSIVADEAGVLWLGTAHGLVQYTPATGAARRYRRQDGVLSGEFNRRAALRRRSGEMVFGGVQGLTRFRPELVSARPEPPLAFTRVQKATSRGTLDVDIDQSSFRLGPRDRAFTVDFAALTFAPGPARRYRYRLEGLSPDWIESTEHSVTYATPPPGNYRFQVQAAAGSEGNWAEPGASIQLSVVPPLWRTTWFRLLLATSFLAALWLLHRLRLRQVLATERLRLRISRDLHDEIGAGLSSIALLSDAVGTMNRLEDGERSQLRVISQYARDMVADLRDIVWAIDPDADRLQDVVSRMKDVAADLLRDASVNFQEPEDADLTEKIGMAVRRDLLLIYKEVVHNIARHARATMVEIQLSARGDVVVLEVSDNGRGFDPDAVRTGTGLKSMRERAARIGGRLELTSRVAGGTQVRLALKKA